MTKTNVFTTIEHPTPRFGMNQTPSAHESESNIENPSIIRPTTCRRCVVCDVLVDAWVVSTVASITRCNASTPATVTFIGLNTMRQKETAATMGCCLSREDDRFDSGNEALLPKGRNGNKRVDKSVDVKKEGASGSYKSPSAVIAAGDACSKVPAKPQPAKKPVENVDLLGLNDKPPTPLAAPVIKAPSPAKPTETPSPLAPAAAAQTPTPPEPAAAPVMKPESSPKLAGKEPSAPKPAKEPSPSKPAVKAPSPPKPAPKESSPPKPAAKEPSPPKPTQTLEESTPVKPAKTSPPKPSQPSPPKDKKTTPKTSPKKPSETEEDENLMVSAFTPVSVNAEAADNDDDNDDDNDNDGDDNEGDNDEAKDQTNEPKPKKITPTKKSKKKRKKGKK
ncbi:uncharacterized protein PITG_12670 [Phytophthora infestans T30-4]|uniref:Uncharacterized protein n=2 Tax=Phytophthora infestans TaxID=4787 RepID=D0NKX3_PHYIT|nr:uncharacterized protein PITG_12670 [Phytophthora infestans T30-4]EEY60291.1 conserved hypothetical protein [Phytophthora infestans T30-4]|eukprot:XP_002900087.1 conserved hypothetical protein [Phytophthora infestans T30-4]